VDGGGDLGGSRFPRKSSEAQPDRVSLDVDHGRWRRRVGERRRVGTQVGRLVAALALEEWEEVGRERAAAGLGLAVIWGIEW
jgi:hypothetical protein